MFLMVATSLLVKHRVIEDIHNSWLYPFKLGFKF